MRAYPSESITQRNKRVQGTAGIELVSGINLGDEITRFVQQIFDINADVPARTAEIERAVERQPARDQNSIGRICEVPPHVTSAEARRKRGSLSQPPRFCEPCAAHML